MKKILIKNASITNEGVHFIKDILIHNDRIEKIDANIPSNSNCEIIDAEGLIIVPGCIDDQVHFREPGLTHKATIFSESRAAVAGGITSFMEMPNTIPNTLTQELLEEKYSIGANDSIANFSFFMGASNENIEEVLKTDSKNVCGIKVFMGSSTGNMLVDNETTLSNIFSKSDLLIATHCEDEPTIRKNLELFKIKYGDNIPIEAHPIIRNEEACYLSSSLAVSLAKKYGSRLHVLHISTAKELTLFEKGPLQNKKITAEACIHHLWFCDSDYQTKGNLIKWNPAVKTMSDRDAIIQAVIDDQIDVIATDHAPHTLEEKSQNYLNSPSGGPLVQYALLAMLEKVCQGVFTLEKVVEKMCHAPSELFKIENRGYIREGYYADLVIINPNKKTIVSKDNILSKCKWSPFEGYSFSNSIEKTLVNGKIVYDQGRIIDNSRGMRLTFNR
jgi:dihydroorotase